MKKINVKENIGLIVGLSIGMVAIIASIATYCGIYFSTPNYLLIKNNEVVIDLDTYDEDGNLNKDKYYTLSDTDLIHAELDTTDETLKEIYFETDDFFKANFGYKTFELNLHFDVIALETNLEEPLYVDGDGIEFYYLTKNEEKVVIQNKTFNTYPTTECDFTYTFNLNDDISRIGFRVDTVVCDEEGKTLSAITIDADTFYFSVLGV